MAKKKATKNGFVFHGFVQCDLSKSEQEECRKWAVGPEDLMLKLDELVDADFTVKLSQDNYNECYQCVLGAPGEDGTPSGWYLAGRGSTCMKAVKQCLFKHFMIMDGLWDEHKKSYREPDFD